MAEEETAELRYRPDRDAIWKGGNRKSDKKCEKLGGRMEFPSGQIQETRGRHSKKLTFSVKARKKVADIVDHPKIPKTSNGVIGWLANDRRFSLEIFGRQANPIRELYKNLEWPVEGCP